MRTKEISSFCFFNSISLRRKKTHKHANIRSGVNEKCNNSSIFLHGLLTMRDDVISNVGVHLQGRSSSRCLSQFFGSKKSLKKKRYIHILQKRERKHAFYDVTKPYNFAVSSSSLPSRRFSHVQILPSRWNFSFANLLFWGKLHGDLAGRTSKLCRNYKAIVQGLLAFPQGFTRSLGKILSDFEL